MKLWHNTPSTPKATGLAWLLTAWVLLFSLSSCVGDRYTEPFIPEEETGDYYLAMSITPRSDFKRGDPIQVDKLDADRLKHLKEAENHIRSVRVLIFDHATGQCLVNQLLGNYTQPQDVATPWTHPVRIPGKVESLDFFFVANEYGTSYRLMKALKGVTHRYQLYLDPGLTKIPWDPEFFPIPDNIDFHNDVIPMTAVYTDFNLKEAKRKGILGKGTEQDPYRFLSKNKQLYQVKLTRVLARIDIKIPEVVMNSTLGDPHSTEVLAFSYITDFEMALVNVPRYFALFASRVFDPTLWTSTIYNPIVSHYYIDPKDGQTCYYIEDDVNHIRRNMAPNKEAGSGPIGVIDPSDYYTILYVPEYIRPESEDGEQKPEQLEAMKIRLIFKVNRWDPKKRKPDTYHVYAYPVLDKISDRTTEARGMLAEGGSKVSNNSVIRNTQYQITIKELVP